MIHFFRAVLEQIEQEAVADDALSDKSSISDARDQLADNGQSIANGAERIKVGQTKVIRRFSNSIAKRSSVFPIYSST